MVNTQTPSTYKTEVLSTRVHDYNVYQFYYNRTHQRPGSVWPAAYLLLKSTMDNHMLEVFQHPAVVQAIMVAYANGDMGLRSDDVPTKWKGIGLGMLLCSKGYTLLEDGDKDTALVLLEAGDWLGMGGNTFHTLTGRPLITADGNLNLQSTL